MSAHISADFQRFFLGTHEALAEADVGVSGHTPAAAAIAANVGAAQEIELESVETTQRSILGQSLSSVAGQGATIR